MPDDLASQVADLRVELERRHGEIMNECTKLTGDVLALDHRVSAVEATGDEGTDKILRAIDASLVPVNGRAKSAGMVAAGGGLGAGIVKLIEYLTG